MNSSKANYSTSYISKGDGINSYKIIRKLNKGAFATVYEAEHLIHQKRVAIKIVSEVLFIINLIGANGLNVL